MYSMIVTLLALEVAVICDMEPRPICSRYVISSIAQVLQVNPESVGIDKPFSPP